MCGEKVQTASGRLRKEMVDESYLCVGSGVFTDNCGLVHMFSQAYRNQSKQGQGPGVQHESLIPWNQGVLASSRGLAQGVWNKHMMTLPRHSIDIIQKTPKKSLTPYPLQGGLTLRHLQHGRGRSQQEQKKEREQKQIFMKSFSFPLSIVVWLRILERRRNGLPLP